ncbi:unnamed protein product [Lampetra fluviatilis]
MCSRRRHRQTTNAAKNAADGGRGLGTTPQRPPCYGAASLQGDVARAALDTARSAASRSAFRGTARAGHCRGLTPRTIRSAGCGNASPLRAAPPCRRRVWVGGANNSAPGIRTTPAVAAAASTVDVFHDATRLDASPSLGNKRRTQNSQIRSSKLGLRESAAARLPQTHRASARPRWLISGRAVKKFRAVAAMLVAPGDRWRHRDRSQKTPGGDAVATAATAATAVNAAAASGAATHRRERVGGARRSEPRCSRNGASICQERQHGCRVTAPRAKGRESGERAQAPARELVTFSPKAPSIARNGEKFVF